MEQAKRAQHLRWVKDTITKYMVEDPFEFLCKHTLWSDEYIRDLLKEAGA